jgi:hypothetical protein
MEIGELAVTVEGIRVQSNNTASAVSKIELGMKDQDAKLDLLVADLNQRKGAAVQSKLSWGRAAALIAAAVGLAQIVEVVKALAMGKH